jgi:hypothetical protein
MGQRSKTTAAKELDRRTRSWAARTQRQAGLGQPVSDEHANKATPTHPPSTGRLVSRLIQARSVEVSAAGSATRDYAPPGQKVRPGVLNSSEKTSSHVSPVWVVIE